MVTWTQDEKYFYIYGGDTEIPDDADLNVIYKLEVDTMTWSTQATTGEAPPLEFRRNNWAIYGEGKLYNLVLFWDNPNSKHEETGEPYRAAINSTCYVLNTVNWTWTKNPTQMNGNLNSLWGNGIAFHDKKLFFFCGMTVSVNRSLVTSNSIAKLDTETWYWHLVSVCYPMPTACMFPSWIQLGNIIYICGGKTYHNTIPNYLPLKIHALTLVSNGSHTLTDLTPNFSSVEDKEGHLMLLPPQTQRNSIKYAQRTQDNNSPYLNMNPVDEIGLSDNVDSYENKILLFGGVDNSKNSTFNSHGSTNSDTIIYRYKKSTNSMTKTVLEPSRIGPRRAFAAGTIIKNKLLIFGGKNDGKFYNDVHIMLLDPTDYPPLLEIIDNQLEPLLNTLNQSLKPKPEKKKKKRKKN
jgi:hypothetical protein